MSDPEPTGLSHRRMEILKKDLRNSRRTPLVGPILIRPRIRKEFANMVQDCAGSLQSLRYRDIIKWKDKARFEFPVEVYRGVLISICALKWHTVVYKQTHKACMYIIKNLFNVEGLELYEQYIVDRARIMDRFYAKDPSFAALRSNCKMWQIERSCNDSVTGKPMFGDFWPSIKCLPLIDYEKESKVYLGFLENPCDRVVSNFRIKAEKFLKDNCPKELPQIDIKGCYSLDQSWYSDDGVKRKNCEEPQNSWNGAFIYESFWTTPTNKREIWVPSKEYKIYSLYWHLFSEPILRSIPEIAGNDSARDIHLSTVKRMTPCKKIDLKGFGLQFPREYVKIIIDILHKMYPYLNNKIAYDASIRLMDDIRIIKGKEMLTPNRGIGLGYFANIMTLAVRIALEDCYIVKMFSDDILVKESDYHKARTLLTNYGFVINEKKSGELYKTAPLIANMQCTKFGISHSYEVNGTLAGCFLNKHHHTRKQIFMMMPYRHKWKLRYHYERMFGYECRRCEVYDHPEMWGLNPNADKQIGYVTGGLLRKYTTERVRDILPFRVFSEFFPFKTERKEDFSRIRYKARKYARYRYFTVHDSYLHPDLDYVKINPYNRDGTEKKNSSVPQWYDLRQIILNHISYGRYQRGLSLEDTKYSILRYSLCKDPVGTYKRGGCIIKSTHHKMPVPDEFQMQVYNALLDCKELENYTVKRTDEFLSEDDINQSPEYDSEELINAINDIVFPKENVPPDIESLDIDSYLNEYLDDIDDIQFVPDSPVEGGGRSNSSSNFGDELDDMYI